MEFLTVYAFSTENWRRPAEEVAALFVLLEQFIEQETPTLMENNVRLRTIGRLQRAAREQPGGAAARRSTTTAGNTGITLIMALNYSARTEIEDAVRAHRRARSRRASSPPTTIDQETISQTPLYRASIPIPICSSAPRASCASRIFSSGSFPTRKST